MASSMAPQTHRNPGETATTGRSLRLAVAHRAVEVLAQAAPATRRSRPSRSR